MKSLFSVFVLAFALLFAAGQAAGDEPQPPDVTVVPADVTMGPVVAPGQPSPIPACRQTITLRNDAHQPWPGVFVEVQFYAGVNVCPGAVLTGVTNENGAVILDITAGGCISGSNACLIRMNGVIVRAYTHVRSPDRDGNLAVNLVDLLVFAQDYAQHATGCSDFGDNGGTDLSDLMIFASAYAPQHSCP